MDSTQNQNEAEVKPDNWALHEELSKEYARRARNEGREDPTPAGSRGQRSPISSPWKAGAPRQRTVP